jgi:hypothetical protein
MAELQKHPYHSSNFLLLILVEKPGTGIFLMRSLQSYTERKKNVRRKSWPSDCGHPEKQSKIKKAGGAKNKRKILGEEQFAEVPQSKPGYKLMKYRMK